MTYQIFEDDSILGQMITPIMKALRSYRLVMAFLPFPTSSFKKQVKEPKRLGKDHNKHALIETSPVLREVYHRETISLDLEAGNPDGGIWKTCSHGSEPFLSDVRPEVGKATDKQQLVNKFDIASLHLKTPTPEIPDRNRGTRTPVQPSFWEFSKQLGISKTSSDDTAERFFSGIMDGRRYRFENVDGRKLYTAAEEGRGPGYPDSSLRRLPNESVNVTRPTGLSSLPGSSLTTSKSKLKGCGCGCGVGWRMPLGISSTADEGECSSRLELLSTRPNLEEPSLANSSSSSSSMPDSPLLLLSRRKETRVKAFVNSNRTSRSPTRQKLSRRLLQTNAAHSLVDGSLNASSGTQNILRKNLVQKRDFAIWEDEDENDRTHVNGINSNNDRTLQELNINEKRAAKPQHSFGKVGGTIERTSEDKENSSSEISLLDDEDLHGFQSILSDVQAFIDDFDSPQPICSPGSEQIKHAFEEDAQGLICPQPTKEQDFAALLVDWEKNIRCC